MYVANMATTDYMQGHQKETAAFVKSIVEASRYLHTNQSESAQIMAKVVPKPRPRTSKRPTTNC